MFMALVGITRKLQNAENTRPASTLPNVLSGEIGLTEAAARRIREQIAAASFDQGGLLVAVQGGGCSGLSYVFTIVETPPTSDHRRFTSHDATIFVDEKSMRVLGGTIVDLHQELGKTGYVMRNPNAHSVCSCGSSFSLG
jgi:iron-sulfur cluster insertion protein